MCLSLAIETNFLNVKASDSAVSSLRSASPDDTVASPASLLPSPTTTLASPTDYTQIKSAVMADNERFRQILAAYPPAITDFYGSGTVCLYKTGPAWPVAEGQVNLVRAARPLYNVEKSPMWLQTAWAIVGYLDSLDAPMLLTTVDPLAYANVGEAALICDFVVVISVKPNSLAQGDAVAAAPGVIAILENAKFSEVQVAFVEGDYHRQAKFMPFDPNSELESTAILRKPFSLTLSLSIASHRTPHYEGTGGVFIRLSSDESDKRVFVLTCAHIACPPPNFENRSYTRKNPSQARENFVLLGSKSYNNSVNDIMNLIGDQTIAITSWQTSLNRIPEYAEDEPTSRTDRRNQLTTLIAVAKKSILTANELHNAVTKTYALTDSRVFGYVFHSAKIEVGDDGYMYDWALIQLDTDKLEAGNFQGNKLYVGGNKTAVDWENYMFPQAHDSCDFHIPDDLLLQLQDYVCEEEFHDPQNYDINNVKTLLAVKNGCATGTTFGRVNGLESITREYTDHGLKVDAVEIVVLGYDTKMGKNDRFSDKGDSGAMAADRCGRLIGPITGGGGPTNATDKTYITPYYRLKKKIEAKFEKAHLLPDTFDFLFA